MSDALLAQMNHAAKAEDWTQLEGVARHWLSQQKFFVPHLFLIHALLAQKNTEEADREFDALASYKFNLADRLDGFPAIKARYQRKLADHYVISTMRPHVSFEGSGMTSSTRRWELPTSNGRPARILGWRAAGDRCVTAGAEEARQVGRGDLYVRFLFRRESCAFDDRTGDERDQFADRGESINSTFANRVLMEVVCRQLTCQAHRDMAARIWRRVLREAPTQALGRDPHRIDGRCPRLASSTFETARLCSRRIIAICSSAVRSSCAPRAARKMSRISVAFWS